MTMERPRGFLKSILEQQPARTLLPVATPEDVQPEPGPDWSAVRPAKGIERRLTAEQAPELHEIFERLAQRRAALKAQVKEHTEALTRARQELEALDPAYCTMASCIVPVDGEESAQPEN